MTHHHIIPSPTAIVGDFASAFTRLAPGTIADAGAAAIAFGLCLVYVITDYTWNRPDKHGYIWYQRPQEQDAAGRAASQTTRNIAQRLDELSKGTVIFWGSQSGRGEGFANRLSRELLQRFKLPVLCADLSDFDPESIALIPRTKFVVFIVSTYGEGDPSDNATQFWEWATRCTNKDLHNLRYFAFGLGNSTYQHYNSVVDLVDQCLKNRGALQLLPPGKADDATGRSEDDFYNWKQTMFHHLVSKMELEEHDPRYEAALSTVHDTSLDSIHLHHGRPVMREKTSKESPIRAVAINYARELFTRDTRNCLHLELALAEHPELVYKTGDHVGIWAMNPDLEVNRLLAILGLTDKGDTPVSITALDPAFDMQIPTPTTIAALFRYYLEICAPVSREIARAMVEFAPSEEVKLWLTNLTMSEETYRSYVDRNHINIGRLCEAAVATHAAQSTWEKMPLSYLLENIPRMRPRYYSISSSSVLSPRTVAMTVLVSLTHPAWVGADDCQTTAPIPGLATAYLLGKAGAEHSIPYSHNHPRDLEYRLPGPLGQLAGGKVYAHIRRSTFKLPFRSECPVIMLASGTGIAPFRAFIAERARLMEMGKCVGEMILFFGCRHPNDDYIYRDELHHLKTALGAKLEIVVAFSRPGQGHGQKRYIQHTMTLHSNTLVRLVAEDASVYACGRAAMARDAGAMLASIIAKNNDWGQLEMQQWTASMKRSHKWQEDVWG